MLGLHRATGGRVDRTGALYYWEHKVYFTERGLRQLLRRCGMRTVAVERWTSPRAKMTNLLANPDALGTSALYRGIGARLPLRRPATRDHGPRQQAHHGGRPRPVRERRRLTTSACCGAVS